MNAKRFILVVGSIALLLLMATVAAALFFVHKLETEKNQARTAKAREARHRQERTVEQPREEVDLKETDDETGSTVQS